MLSLKIEDIFRFADGKTVIVCAAGDREPPGSSQTVDILVDGELRQSLTVWREMPKIVDGKTEDKVAFGTAEVVELSTDEIRGTDRRLVFKD